MIVRIFPPRQDNKTSFTKLFDYITNGLEANGGDMTMVSFNDLTQYITADTALDGMGDLVEKTLAVEIGHLTSLQSAAAEMWAVAKQNPRAQNPVLHYMISWKEHERPAVEDVLAAARYTLAAIGLSDHQYVIAIHVNTDNLHAHIEVNRVHPISYKSHHIEWAHKTLHRALRELEIQYGWAHDNGLYAVVEVDGKKMIVPSSSSLDPEVAKPSAGARAFETWSGTESFETWCKGEPATALKKALEKGTVKEWADVHRVMADFGIELQSTGTGFRVVSQVAAEAGDHEGAAPSTVGAAVSKAFRFLKPKELEARLGAFEAFDPAMVAGRPAPQRAYKRDPLKRMERRIDRQAQREDLLKRFREERRHSETNRYALKAKVKRQQAKSAKERFEILRKSHQEKRQALIADKSIPPDQKRQLYVLQRLSYEQAKEDLRAQLAEERKAIASLLPPKKSWRAWVEQLAQEGDPAAISALRGMVYRERKEAKQLGADGEELPLVESNVPAQLQPADPEAEDAPTIRPIRQLEWRVTTNGRIMYTFAGKDNEGRRLAFIDEGARLSYGRADVSDRALIASLEYAKMKWGPTLRLKGGDAVFQKRVLEAALALGMRVENPELQALQREILAKTPAPKVAPRKTSRLQGELEKLKRSMPGLAVGDAQYHANGTRYSGKVLAVVENRVIQQTGKNAVTLHDLQRLGAIPKARDVAAIQYQDGFGRVDITSRNRGKGR